MNMGQRGQMSSQTTDRLNLLLTHRIPAAQLYPLPSRRCSFATACWKGYPLPRMRVA
jgi:hypothetical protein